MRTETALLVGLLILAFGGLVYAVFGFFGLNFGKSTNLDAGNLGLQAISTGTTGDGDVAIELTPLNFAEGKLIVAFAANTHSVALDKFDLSRITVLEYEGKAINPSSAPIMSGHHVNGKLVFNIGKKIGSFIIKINSLPKIKERVFEWK